MKRFAFVCTLVFGLCSLNAQAQGLGGLLKKVKKGVETVTGTSTTSSSQSSQTAAKDAAKGVEIPVEGGGTMVNPIPSIADIQLVGAYGKSTSLNYGEVRLVFKVKMIANLTSLSFGCNTNYPALMIDQDGNSYKPKEIAGWHDYTVTEGVFMKMPLKDSAPFVDVKRTATTIQRLQYGVSVGYGKTGLIVLKDVPIQWDVTTE